MTKLTDLSLDDLYARKITSTTEHVIMLKEDFSKQAPRWCEKVCKLKCKDPPGEGLLVPTGQKDILLVQDHMALEDTKYKRSSQVMEDKNQDIVRFIMNRVIDHNLRLDGTKLTWAMTNLTRCRIGGEDVKRGKAPTDTVLQKCKPYLFEEIKLRRPKVIVSLTTSCTKALGLKKSNYNDRGEITQTAEGVPLVLTVHPRILAMLRQNASGKLWGPDYFSTIENDLDKAAKIATGHLRVPNLDEALERAKNQVTIARSLEDVRMMVSKLKALSASGTVLSFDTETTSLDAYLPTAKIITLQFGFKNPTTGVFESYVFPHRHRDNVWFDPNESWKLIASLLVDEKVLKIAHNGKFDVIYVAVTEGVRVKGIIVDTMLLLHWINSGVQGTYSLKTAVWDWLPETELGNYEDKLPKLTKTKGTVEDEEESEETEEEVVYDD